MSVATSTLPRIEAGPHTFRMLVCLDRSPTSAICLPYAVSIARTFGSDITLVHVMQPRHGDAGPHTTDALGWEISRQEAGAYLERLGREATRELGRAVDIRLEQGHPAERIVALARELQADLTVLGSHGEGGVAAWNLGTTAQQVVAMTRGSVFIVHSSPVAPSVAIPKRILVPLDGSLRTESVLPTAVRIARAYGAEIVLVHVVQAPIASSVLRAGAELVLATDLAAQLESSARLYLQSVRDRLAHEGPAVRTLVVRHPNERQGLLEVAQQEHADLVVISAHGVACDPARSFGSVTAHLLAHAPVPMLVLQDLPYQVERPNGLPDQLAPPLRASFTPEAV